MFKIQKKTAIMKEQGLKMGKIPRLLLKLRKREGKNPA
jgi:hypothetical protein